MVEAAAGAQLASLRAEVGAFLGSGALTRAFGTVGGEAGHPWHHFGSWVAGVEELQLKFKAVRFGCRDGDGRRDLRDMGQKSARCSPKEPDPVNHWAAC